MTISVQRVSERSPAVMLLGRAQWGTAAMDLDAGAGQIAQPPTAAAQLLRSQGKLCELYVNDRFTTAVTTPFQRLRICRAGLFHQWEI